MCVLTVFRVYDLCHSLKVLGQGEMKKKKKRKKTCFRDEPLVKNAYITTWNSKDNFSVIDYFSFKSKYHFVEICRMWNYALLNFKVGAYLVHTAIRKKY